MLGPMPKSPAPDPLIVARIRQRLADRIELTGITITRLAERSGVAKSTIYRLLREGEDGDALVSTLTALARVLLIDVAELFEPLPDGSAPRRNDDAGKE